MLPNKKMYRKRDISYIQNIQMLQDSHINTACFMVWRQLSPHANLMNNAYFLDGCLFLFGSPREELTLEHGKLKEKNRILPEKYIS